MGLEEYLNLPGEDVTSVVYDFIIEFSENEQNATEFIRMWESSDLAEVVTEKSKKMWDAIAAQLEMSETTATHVKLKPSKKVSPLAWKVA